MSKNIKELMKILENINNPNPKIIIESDEKLKYLKLDSFYLVDLLNIINYKEITKEKRLAAAILLKKELEIVNKKNKKQVINLNSKLFDYYFQMDDLKIVKIVTYNLKNIFQIFSNDELNEFFWKLNQHLEIILKNQNQNQIILILYLFKNFSKLLELKIDNEREVNNKFANLFFFTFEKLLNDNINIKEKNINNYLIIYLIYTIYFNTSRLGILDYLFNLEKSKFWYNSMIYFMNNYNISTSQDNNIIKFMYKIKSVIFRICICFTSTSYSSKNDKIKKYFKFCHDNFLIDFFKINLIFLNNINLNKENDKYIKHSLRLWMHIIKLYRFNNKEIIFKDEILHLLKEKFITFIKLTEDEIQEFDLSPIEYFKNNQDIYFNNNSKLFVILIYNEVLMIIGLRDIFINYLIETINKLIEVNNYLILEALFNLIRHVDKVLKDMNEYTNYINNYVLKYIYFGLESNQPILIFRSLYLLEIIYKGNDFSTEIENDILKKLSKFLESNIKPIKLQTAICFETLMKNPNNLNQVKPYTKQLILIFLNLINESESDSVINCFNNFIKYLKEDIISYSYDIITVLCNFVIKFYNKIKQIEKNKEISNFEDYDISIFSIFNSMYELISVINDEKILISIDEKIWETFVKILEEKDYEMVNEILLLIKLILSKFSNIPNNLFCYYQINLKLLNSNIYKDLTQNNNNINPRLIKIIHFKTQSEELITNSSWIILLFIKKYKENLINIKDHLGNNYIDLSIENVLYSIDILITNNDTDFINNPLFILIQILFELRYVKLNDTIYLKILNKLFNNKLISLLQNMNIIYSCLLLIMHSNYILVFNFLKQNNLINIFLKQWSELLYNKIYKYQKIAFLTLIYFLNLDFFKLLDYNFMYLLTVKILNDLKFVLNLKQKCIKKNDMNFIEDNEDEDDEEFENQYKNLEDSDYDNDLFFEYDDFSENLEFYNLNEFELLKIKIQNIKISSPEFFNIIVSPIEDKQFFQKITGLN